MSWTRAKLEDYVHGRLSIEDSTDVKVALKKAATQYGENVILSMLLYVSGYDMFNPKFDEVLQFLTKELYIQNTLPAKHPFTSKEILNRAQQIFDKYTKFWT